MHTTVPDGDPPSTRAWRAWITFGTIAYVLALMLAGSNLPTPLYPIYREAFGFGPLVLTLIFGCYVAALIPSLLSFGPLSDVVGRRRVLYIGVILGVIGSVLFALAENTAWLFFARITQGIAVGATSGAAAAALADVEPTGNKARAALTASAAMILGSAAGPLLGGILVQYAPMPRRLCFTLHVLLLLVGALALTTLGKPRTKGSWKPTRPAIPAAMRGTFLVSATTAFLVWAVVGVFLALVPSFLSSVLHTHNAVIAGGAAALLLGSSATIQLMFRSASPLPAKLTGLCLVTVGLIGLAEAGQLQSIPLVVAASILGGFGHGLAFLGAITDVNLAAPPNRRGEVVSGFFVVAYTGLALPIVGVGVLAMTTGLVPAVTTFAVITALACVILAAVLTWRYFRIPDRARTHLNQHP